MTRLLILSVLCCAAGCGTDDSGDDAQAERKSNSDDGPARDAGVGDDDEPGSDGDQRDDDERSDGDDGGTDDDGDQSSGADGGTDADDGPSDDGDTETDADEPDAGGSDDDDSVIGEPDTDESDGDDSNADDSNADDSDADEPDADEPDTDEPNTDDPATAEPDTDDSATDETDADEPTTGNTGSPQSEPAIPEGFHDPATGDCTFSIEASISPQISTVGIVQWSVDLDGLDAASIEFGPADSTVSMQAPVDLSDPDHRTLLLGMKANSEYAFHVVAQASDEICSSDSQTLTTGQLPSSLPANEVEVMGESAPGFLVVTPGLATFGSTNDGIAVYILDHDGDPVWWMNGPADTSRARLDWSGNVMYAMSMGWPQANNPNGFVGRTMDGMQEVTIPEELLQGHHDFAVTPDGITAIAHNGGCGALVHWDSDSGAVSELVPDLEALYTRVGTGGAGASCHVTSLSYHDDAEAYTLVEADAGIVLKLDLSGNLIWQLGGANPLGDHVEIDDSWGSLIFGHHLVDGDTLLIFDNNGATNGGSIVWEYAVDESDLTAVNTWSYQSEAALTSTVMGDVQRLDNGNTLVTYSTVGTIQEVQPDGTVVRQITASGQTPYGYVTHRESLYGHPTK